MNKIHFIGIGGIGMSGLARLLKYEGKEVSGSDVIETENTQKLIEEDIPVVYEQKKENIQTEPPFDLVIYTEAIHQDNPELQAAKDAGIPTMNYFEALGEMANEYYVIAVAGTHGKTTTTAMLTDILEEASFDPTAIIGALRTKTGSNFRPGKSKYFIVEACEYKRDFLTLEPDMLIITNIEHEHVDYYKNLSDVQDAFRELAQKVPEEGDIIALTSDKNTAPVLKGVKAKVHDYKAAIFQNFSLTQPGLYNRMNAAAAFTAALTLGVSENVARDALENFAGTQRRFEYKGKINGACIYDDYAHHPTEIEATISGARELYPEKKLTVVFQSHTYSRTDELFDAFVNALIKADSVFLLPIYAAREENKSGVSAEKLAEAIVKKGGVAKYFHTFEGVTVEFKESVNENDVVIIMGAGDVTEVSRLLMR